MRDVGLVLRQHLTSYRFLIIQWWVGLRQLCQRWADESPTVFYHHKAMRYGEYFFATPGVNQLAMKSTQMPSNKNFKTTLYLNAHSIPENRIVNLRLGDKLETSSRQVHQAVN